MDAEETGSTTGLAVAEVDVVVAVGTSNRIEVMETATEVVAAAAVVAVAVVVGDMETGTVAISNSNITLPRRRRGSLRRRPDIPASVSACLPRRRLTPRADTAATRVMAAARITAMTITRPASSKEAVIREATRGSNTGRLRARARTGVMMTDGAAVIRAGTIAIHIASDVWGGGQTRGDLVML